MSFRLDEVKEVTRAPEDDFGKAFSEVIFNALLDKDQFRGRIKLTVPVTVELSRRIVEAKERLAIGNQYKEFAQKQIEILKSEHPKYSHLRSDVQCIVKMYSTYTRIDLELRVLIYGTGCLARFPERDTVARRESAE